MTPDRAWFEMALKHMQQTEGLTKEERKRRCVELLVQAQYMDSEQYLRMMHDSTKRPWVGLTGLEQKELMAMGARNAVFATEAKLKEKNSA